MSTVESSRTAAVTIDAANTFNFGSGGTGLQTKTVFHLASSSFSGSITVKSRPIGGSTFSAVSYQLQSITDSSADAPLSTAAITDSCIIEVETKGSEVALDCTSYTSGSMVVTVDAPAGVPATHATTADEATPGEALDLRIEAVEASAGPGGWASKDILFTEGATPGTYSATMDVEAGTVIADIQGFILAGPWAADTAKLRVGDTSHGSTFYYDPAYGVGGLDFSGANYFTGTYGDALVDNTGFNDSNSLNLALFGNLITSPLVGGGSTSLGVRYAVDDTIEFEMTTVIGTPPVVPVGILRLKVLYITPASTTNATFA